MTGRLVLMCAVLLPILAQATVIGAEDIALLRAGVVKITAKPPGGSPQVGTGFIVRINRDRESVYIITAAHVVSGDPRPQVEFFPKRNVLVPAEVLGAEGSDEVRGLAMLMVRGNANIPSDIAALQLASDIHLGEDIILIGFPRGAGPSAIIRGNVSSREGHDIYFSPTVGEGNSGGPIIQNGKVVGLVGAGNQSMGQGVTARSIEDYIEGFGLPAQGSTSDSKTEIQEAKNITQPPPPPAQKPFKRYPFSNIEYPNILWGEEFRQGNELFLWSPTRRNSVSLLPGLECDACSIEQMFVQYIQPFVETLMSQGLQPFLMPQFPISGTTLAINQGEKPPPYPTLLQCILVSVGGHPEVYTFLGVKKGNRFEVVMTWGINFDMVNQRYDMEEELQSFVNQLRFADSKQHLFNSDP